MSVSEKGAFKWKPEGGEKEKEKGKEEKQKLETAKAYISKLKKWGENQLKVPMVFPPYASSVYSQKKSQIQKQSIEIIRDLNRRLFRVFCHVYYMHWIHLVKLNALPLAKVFFL